MAFHYTYNYPQVARDGGFKLRNCKDGSLDWRLIGSMEIERIVRDQSFEQVDAALNHLSEAPLGPILDSHILDSGIAKYFMLSQFSVQYLLFCRKFLEETVAELRESHNNSQMELATAKRSLSEARNEILQLHKKLTQMEAIHEVLYPCHLCTKNFVNNDSLNLHISRKHNGSFVKPEKKDEITHSLCKERENDLTLINTIKLELEIKHLKERLNRAEREIKEKNLESDMKNGLEKSETKYVHSIGIQSNLSEIKEQDDSGQDNENISTKNRQQMSALREKLQEFEKWKETQVLSNSEFLNIVNSKIQELSATLEITRSQMEMQRNHDKNRNPLLQSAEDLEKMLTKKVEEIGLTTAANLEDIAKKLEISYNEKLQLFEKELNKLNKQYILQQDQAAESATIKVHRETSKPVEKNVSSNKSKEFGNQPSETTQIKQTSDSESNHTFVKDDNKINVEKTDDGDGASDGSSFTSGITGEGSLDFSDNLPCEEILNKACSELENNDRPMTHIRRHRKKLLTKLKGNQKVVTKKKAQEIANKRLCSLGVDTSAKTLTPLLRKRYFALNEERIKLEQKNSQFYTTRDRIKKFVEKLFSTKISSNAEALLKVTEHIKPKDPNFLHSDEYSTSEEEEVSTCSNELPLPENQNFKKRLERILDSPLRKPDGHRIDYIANNEVEDTKPIPMPRKRVVFNQPEVQK